MLLHHADMMRGSIFFSLLVQLEIVPRGQIVHVIGQANDAIRILKRLRAVVVCH